GNKWLMGRLDFALCRNVLALLVGCFACPFVRADAAKDAGLHVPEGYTIQRVDADLVFPMFACFDDRGRLFVAESSGLDLYAELKAQTSNCRFKLLKDSDVKGGFLK